MPYDTAAPVEVIEGIGPAAGAALRAAGLATVLDLVAHSSRQIHPHVRHLASLSEVKGWRAMAGLLPITDGDVQLAEALVRGGRQTPESIANAGFSALDQMFREAHQAGMVPSAPDAATLSRLAMRAAVACVTAGLAGEVVDEAGVPIPDAQVRYRSEGDATDALGRFWIRTIPLDAAGPLRIAHAGFAFLETSPALVREPTAVVIEKYVLAAVSGAIGDTVTTFSEFDGDELPPLSGLRVTVERHAATALREGDVLLVRQLLVREPRAQLVSRFRRVCDGEVVVDVYRVPSDLLPDGVAPGADVEVQGGALRAVAMGPRLVRQRRLAARRRRAFKSWSGPPAHDGARAHLDALMEFSRAHALNRAGG